MANYIVTDAQMTQIADAIRAKTGESGTLAFPGGFVSGIGGIATAEEAGMTKKTGSLTVPVSSRAMQAHAVQTVSFANQSKPEDMPGTYVKATTPRFTFNVAGVRVLGTPNLSVVNGKLQENFQVNNNTSSQVQVSGTVTVNFEYYG